MLTNQLGAPFIVKGRTYTLLYDFNKLCEMEAVGVELMSGKTDAEKLKSPLYIRQLFFDGCLDDVGKPLPDLTTAGQLIGELGFLPSVKLIGEALAAVTVKGVEGDENPKKARTRR